MVLVHLSLRQECLLIEDEFERKKSVSYQMKQKQVSSIISGSFVKCTFEESTATHDVNRSKNPKFVLLMILDFHASLDMTSMMNYKI